MKKLLIPLKEINYEWCPFCNEEVKLSYVKQKCPNCGKSLVACSACRWTDCSGCTNQKLKFKED